MTFNDKYNFWLNHSALSTGDRDELLGIQDDDREIEERFYKDLSFGTGGLRGVIGVGTNRINAYTVRRATQGLANYILKKDMPGKVGNFNEKRVAIAYDSRNYSKEFALEAALVCVANEIKTFLYEGLRPTPQLSFTVRELGCDAGIVITASHNPSKYNGYKVYGADGGQVTEKHAYGMIEAISKVDIFEDVLTITEQEALDSNMLVYISEDLDNKYIECVKSLANRSGTNIKVVFTAIHGTGKVPVMRTLKELGYTAICDVKEQAHPDGNFTTVNSPNPEDPAALEMAINQAKSEDAELVLGTDPDCDRVGVAVKLKNSEYQLLTGNQIGALLVDYMLRIKDWPSNSALVKTIVTSELGADIARKKGIQIFDTLTGFKYIGEKIEEFKQSGKYNFMMGYEESYGYLVGDFVRDKDGVISAMLIVEIAAWYKDQGLTLLDGLNAIYDEHGYYTDALESLTLEGIEGQNRIQKMMVDFRNLDVMKQMFTDIEAFEDYKTLKHHNLITNQVKNLELPLSDVLKFYFTDQSWVAVRPSGTEPKIKFYYSALGQDKVSSQQRLNELKMMCTRVK